MTFRSDRSDSSYGLVDALNYFQEASLELFGDGQTGQLAAVGQGTGDDVHADVFDHIERFHNPRMHNGWTPRRSF